MKVLINGQSYDDWSQLPPELQRMLAATLPDNDHNGVPDVFEGVLPTATGTTGNAGAPGLTQVGPSTFASASINVNGQQYGSLAELPPEIRQTLQSVFGAALAAGSVPAPGVVPINTGLPTAPPVDGAPAAPVPGQVPNAPSVPAPGQVILNGQPMMVEQQEKKGFLKRLFGR